MQTARFSMLLPHFLLICHCQHLSSHIWSDNGRRSAMGRNVRCHRSAPARNIIANFRSSWLAYRRIAACMLLYESTHPDDPARLRVRLFIAFSANSPMTLSQAAIQISGYRHVRCCSPAKLSMEKPARTDALLRFQHAQRRLLLAGRLYNYRREKLPCVVHFYLRTQLLNRIRSCSGMFVDENRRPCPQQ